MDGTLVGEAVGPSVIRERESLATGGVCSVVFKYDQQKGRLVGEPTITSRGFANFEAIIEIVEGTKTTVRQTLASTKPGTPPTAVEEAVGKALSHYFFQQVRNRPAMLVTAVPTN